MTQRRLARAMLCADKCICWMAAVWIGCELLACNVYDDDLLKKSNIQDSGTKDAGNSSNDGQVDNTGGGSGNTGSGGTQATGATVSKDATIDDDAGMPWACGSTFMDRDGDGVEDCLDNCPDDKKKVEPEFCGCGYSEVDDGKDICPGLASQLVHRYRFNDTATTAIDSIGSANADISGTSLDGSGDFRLVGGGSGDYATLPAGVLTAESKGGATIELWISWPGGATDERIFDFGAGAPNEPSAACIYSEPFHFDSQWYFYCTTPLAWSYALTACSANSGSLVRIDTAAESAFVTENALTEAIPVWIGANDINAEGIWRWSSGAATGSSSTEFWHGDATTGMPVNNAYTDWDADQPDNVGDVLADGGVPTGGDCAELTSSGWKDSPCDETRPFVCETTSQNSVAYTSLYLTPDAGSGVPRLGFLFNGGVEQLLEPAGVTFPSGQQVHVAVVFNDSADTLSLYIQGQRVGSMTTTVSLSTFEDDVNYIGRSFDGTSTSLTATLHEFRIYGAALTAGHVAMSARGGPDPAYLNPPL